jgi:hypothetical protein
MRWLELGILAEIIDRSGMVRKTAGCSIVGRRQFSARMQRLSEIILENSDVQQPWYDLYSSNAEMRHTIDEILRLNGLEADWFTPNQLEGLLFSSKDADGGDQAGWLAVINSEVLSSGAEPIGDPQTIEECIACLSADVEEALMIATELPAQVAFAINKAQEENNQSPEEREAADRAKRLAELKKMDISELLKNG